LLKKLENASDQEELFTLLEREREDASPSEAKEPEAPQAAPASEPDEVLEPGQRVGWPAPSKVAEFYPVALDAWTRLGELARGTRYDLSPREVQVELPVFDGEGQQIGTRKEVQVTEPLTVLAQATAPVAAKRLPALVTTPEAGLALAVAAILLLPAVEHLAQIISSWWGKRSSSSSPKAEPSSLSTLRQVSEVA
jgi:hypothetical protein